MPIHRRPSPLLALAAGLLALLFTLALALALAPAPAAAIVPQHLIVTNAAIAPVEGQEFPGLVATVGDPNGSYTAGSYVANIAWGDGTTTPASFIIVSGGVISVFGTHTYIHTGPTYLRVSVENSIVGSESQGFDETAISVADAPLVPIFSAPSVFSGVGPSATTNGLAAFQAAIGGANNGAGAGEQPAGFRHVNWDGVALDGSQPQNTPIPPHNAVVVPSDSQQERGLELGAPIAVSDDGFAAVNPFAPAGAFPAFSGANIAAPFNANTITFDVVAPSAPGGAPVPAATRGLGVSFLNVRLANATSVEYRNGDSTLAKVFASAGGHGQPTFIGALFAQPIVTSIVVTLGTATIFNFDGVNVEPNASGEEGERNIVAADDLVLAEPAREGPTLAATAGGSVSGAVAEFGDRDTYATIHYYSATIDWGDGTRSAGNIAPAAGGAEGYAVSGSHPYAQAGTYTIATTIQDLVGGGSTTLHATAMVAAPATSVPPLPLATPLPLPGGPPPPQCKLSASLAAKLAAVAAPTLSLATTSAASSASTAAKKKSRRTANRLRAVATCNANVSVQLTATATLTSAAKKGHKASHKAKLTKATVKMLPLGQVSASLTAAHPATLTIALSAATLAKLKAASKAHERISVRLTLAASNSNGTSTSTTTVGSLKL